MTSVAVVIAAFNAADTIGETLDSVAAQTRPADEVIVVDDGSTDATAALAAAHRVGARVISTANHGAAAATNQGVAASSAAFLTFLDADDLWLPAKLASQLAAMTAPGAPDLIFGHMETFVSPEVTAEAEARLVYLKGLNPGWSLGTLMMRRALFDRLGGLDPALRTGYGVDFIGSARAAGLRFAMAGDLVKRRRIRPGTNGFRAPSRPQIGVDLLAVARKAIARRRAAPGGDPT